MVSEMIGPRVALAVNYEVWQINEKTGVKMWFIANKNTTDFYSFQHTPLSYSNTAAYVNSIIQSNTVALVIFYDNNSAVSAFTSSTNRNVFPSMHFLLSTTDRSRMDRDMANTEDARAPACACSLKIVSHTRLCRLTLRSGALSKNHPPTNPVISFPTLFSSV